MAAVMNGFNPKDHYSTPPPSPTRSPGEDSNVDWRSKYYEASDLLAEARQELDEFTRTSRELEEELERDLERTEQAKDDLRQKAAKVEGERDDWKNKFIALQHTHNTTTSSLQRELDATRQSVDLYKAQVRDLELGNDDLERNERQATSSLVDIEQKYAKLIEDKILLEHELQDKAAVEESCQRLRDELRDTQIEVTVLRDQLDQLKQLPLRPVINECRTNSSSSSLPLVSPTGSDNELLRNTAAPDLSLEDLAMPSTPDIPSKRSSISSRLSQEFIDEYAASRASSTSFTSGRSHGTRSNLTSTPTQADYLQRNLSPTGGLTFASGANTRLPTPRRRGAPSPQPTASPYAPRVLPRTTTTTSQAPPRSKGVQMVSEMRARVRTLEQKLHSGMPRLRTQSAIAPNHGGLRPREPLRASENTPRGVSTPRKAGASTALSKVSASTSPWVMVSDDGAGNETMRQSPERPPQLPLVPTISPIIRAPAANFDSGLDSPGLPPKPRSASALGRAVFPPLSSASAVPQHPHRNRSPSSFSSPPTAFPSSTSEKFPQSAGPFATSFRRPPSRVVTLGVPSLSPMTNDDDDDDEPSPPRRSHTPTQLPRLSASGLRRANTAGNPTKPPTTLGMTARLRKDSKVKTGPANTANAGTTPGRTKSFSSETPPPIPSIPHVSDKNFVLGQSRIASGPFSKSKIGRPTSFGVPLGRAAKTSFDADSIGEESPKAEPTVKLVSRNRSGTLN